MRSPGCLLLTGALILAAGCSAPEASTSDEPTAEAPAAVYSPASALTTTDQAITAGAELLETSDGTTWIDGPRPVLAGQMTYAEAVRQIGIGDGDYETWPEETQV